MCVPFPCPSNRLRHFCESVKSQLSRFNCEYDSNANRFDELPFFCNANFSAEIESISRSRTHIIPECHSSAFFDVRWRCWEIPKCVCVLGRLLHGACSSSNELGFSWLVSRECNDRRASISRIFIQCELHRKRKAAAMRSKNTDTNCIGDEPKLHFFCFCFVQCLHRCPCSGDRNDTA